MKVGFIGNANNYPFQIARQLRSLGHEPTFLVTNKTPLDRPETRYPAFGQVYPRWIIDVGHLGPDDIARPKAVLRDALARLRRCEAIVVNADRIALATWVGRPAFVLFTGSDLEIYASPRYPCHLMRNHDARGVRMRLHAFMAVSRLVARQRMAILDCAAYNYFPPGAVPSGDAMLADIGVAPSKRRFFMITDVDTIRPELPPRNTRLRLLYATRLSWWAPSPSPPFGALDIDNKGSDVMLRGVALFVERTGTPIELRLFRKGRDVDRAARLARDLGLADCIRWSDEVTQREILEEYSCADVVLEQTGRSIVGMAGLDAMASARPVIGDGKPEFFERAVGARSPLLQARTAEEVCAQLVRMLDPQARARVGLESREHVERYYSLGNAASIVLEALGG